MGYPNNVILDREILQEKLLLFLLKKKEEIHSKLINTEWSIQYITKKRYLTDIDTAKFRPFEIFKK